MTYPDWGPVFPPASFWVAGLSRGAEGGLGSWMLRLHQLGLHAESVRGGEAHTRQRGQGPAITTDESKGDLGSSGSSRHARNFSTAIGYYSLVPCGHLRPCWQKL